MPNHGNLLGTKQLFMNTCNHAHHGAQEELIHGIQDKQRSLSMFQHVYHWHQEELNLQRHYSSTKVLHQSKVQPWNHTMQIAKELLVEIIKLKKERQANHPKIPSIGTTEQKLWGYYQGSNKCTYGTNNTHPWHSPTQKDTVKSTLQSYHWQKYNNTPKIPTTP